MVDSGIPLGSIIISTADLESMHLRVRFMWSKNILKHGLDVFTPAETAYYNPIVFNGTLDKFPMGRQGSQVDEPKLGNKNNQRPDSP